MQLTTTFFALLASTFSVIPAMAQGSTISKFTILNFDTRFDDPKGMMSTTQCPAEGALAGHDTFGSLPTFPYIAGADFVQGFASDHCGACYELSGTHADGTVVVRTFTIINGAPKGFISSLVAATDLTGFDREHFPGDAPITAKAVPAAHCGL